MFVDTVLPHVGCAPIPRPAGAGIRPDVAAGPLGIAAKGSPEPARQVAR